MRLSLQADRRERERHSRHEENEPSKAWRHGTAQPTWETKCSVAVWSTAWKMVEW